MPLIENISDYKRWFENKGVMVVFMIISKTEPIYELEFGNQPNSSSASVTSGGGMSDDLAYLHQFILYSSLDMAGSAMWTNSAT